MGSMVRGAHFSHSHLSQSCQSHPHPKASRIILIPTQRSESKVTAGTCLLSQGLLKTTLMRT